MISSTLWNYGLCSKLCVQNLRKKNKKCFLILVYIRVRARRPVAYRSIATVFDSQYKGSGFESTAGRRKYGIVSCRCNLAHFVDNWCGTSASCDLAIPVLRHQDSIIHSGPPLMCVCVCVWKSKMKTLDKEG